MSSFVQDRVLNALSKVKENVQISFEMFPPNNDAMETSLWSAIEKLAPIRPRFVSVTYGAGGSTQERTLHVVKRLLNETSLTVMPHLTCVNASRESVLELAQYYRTLGVRHIMALRGDLVPNSRYLSRDDGFEYAVDLVRGLRSVTDFDISVAAYPEVHPEAPSAQFDLDNLKAKLDAGATRAVTQFFFRTETYLRFRDQCAAAGITASIVPGILPITRFAQMQRFAERCGTSVPPELAALFAGTENDAVTHQMVAYAVALEQLQILQAEGINEFHFYTLNRSELTFALCHALGANPAAQAQQHAANQSAFG